MLRRLVKHDSASTYKPDFTSESQPVRACASGRSCRPPHHWLRQESGEAARITGGTLLAAEGKTLVELTLDCLEPHLLLIRQSQRRAGFAEQRRAFRGEAVHPSIEAGGVGGPFSSHDMIRSRPEYECTGPPGEHPCCRHE
jgi:hypothetical protein